MHNSMTIEKDPEAATLGSKAAAWGVLLTPTAFAALGAIPWLAALIIPFAVLAMVTVVTVGLVSKAQQPQRSKRPQRPSGDGWRWSDVPGERGWKRGGIEDEIDAAVAAWKTVYGEDIGYNEHAVTLEWLRSLHRTNELSSDQLADCADNVEWLTWALGQPEQGTRSGTVRAGQRCRCKPSGGSNCKLCFPENPRGGSWLTIQQITEKLAALETRAADTMDKVQAGTLSINEARALVEGVGYLGAQRQAITGEPYPFDRAAYQAHVGRFTAMARPSGYNVKLDRRADADVFERLRAEFRAQHGSSYARRTAVLESDIHPIDVVPCNGCRTETAIGGLHPRTITYCDGSHTREQSLADTIPETATEGR